MRPGLNFFKYGFFILILLNLTLIFFLLRPDPKHRMGPPGPAMVIDRLTRSLNLNDEQKARLKVIFELHEKSKEDMFGQADSMRQVMVHCLETNRDCDSILSNTVNFEKVMYHHHKSIMAILSPEQQKQYIEELKQRKPKDRKGPKGPGPF